MCRTRSFIARPKLEKNHGSPPMHRALPGCMATPTRFSQSESVVITAAKIMVPAGLRTPGQARRIGMYHLATTLHFLANFIAAVAWVVWEPRRTEACFSKDRKWIRSRHWLA